ncbi:MAG: hypothetical protein GY809_12830, partial [Planctomycetes bacterium]|nr:hypothetical protein [Planctomycetota bacterium]
MQRCLVLSFILWSLCVTSVQGTLYLSCEQDNDLYQVLTDSDIECRRFDNPDQAVAQSPPGAGVLILAQGYPLQTTAIAPAVLDEAVRKKTRLYIEFPQRIADMKLGSIQESPLARCVVTSNVFGSALSVNDLLVIHDCQFVEAEAQNPYLVLAKVAGFDKAIFGLSGTTPYPVLFEHPSHSNILVSTTKLSQFVTGRYVPKARWQTIWRMILQWLEPKASFPPLQWTQTVGPTYSRDDVLPADAQRDAVIRGVDWHYNAKMLIHESWSGELTSFGVNNPVGPVPRLDWPVGDGTHGLLEGVHSGIDPSDGSQKIRWWLRTDCNGESS